MQFQLLRLSMTLLCLSAAAVPARGDWMLRLSSGERVREEGPVRITLPREVPDGAALVLSEADSGRPVLVQRMAGTGEAFFLLTNPLPAGETRTYRLQTGDVSPPDPDAAARCVDADGALTLSVGGEPVLTYHTAVVEPPQPFSSAYRRSGFLHPVRTPSGRVLTDPFPVDHPHQHGIFSAWVKTTFEGRSVDFWNQGARTGTVEHRRVIQVENGPVFCSFTVQLAHVDLTPPDGPMDVLHEIWTVRTYAVRAGYLFEIESTQTCATDSPLMLEEYHYGGMAVRGSAEWLGQREHDFLTGDGRTRQDGNHTRPNWVSMHGRVDGEPCSITVFCHPENLRAPQPVRLHPSKPYFVFTPPVLGPFEIAPGSELISRYRFFASDGLPDRERLETLWNAYASPVTVSWNNGRQ